eukprot:scaffold25665_cov113-Cylindrotheca_fusiformis.AAC.2
MPNDPQNASSAQSLCLGWGTLNSFFLLLALTLLVTPSISLTHLNYGDHQARKLSSRRSVFQSMFTAATISTIAPARSRADDFGMLKVVEDPNTYSALAYSGTPPNKQHTKSTPLILVLHGAGRNDQDILSDLANSSGEHAGLIPSLIASGQAPAELLDNFSVLAPYSYGKSSFYQDSRSMLLQFVDWAVNNQGTEACPITFDPSRIILFGFSDGATVAVELLTTRRFAGGVICSYGYSGKALPAKAVSQLANLPLWVFHSADDVIFDVKNSDRLVQQLRSVFVRDIRADDASSWVRYSRYDVDPENLPSKVRGHSMGITASKSADVYNWMMKVPAIS